MVTGRFMHLNIDEKHLHLKCGTIYELSLNLPLRVNPEDTEAVFLIESRNLYVSAKFFNQEPQEIDYNEGQVEPSDNDKNILEENKNKITEKNIKLETNLLDDLV